MKKINIKIIGKFKKLSMASKMTVALFVPMLVICMGILIICYPLMKNEYSEKVLQNTEQSAAQAGAFLDEYIREMSFSLEKICSDPEIIDILEREDFGVPKSVYAEYADFYKLHRRLSEDSEFDTRYQSAIYVPDVLSYATNRLFFYPQSDFENESGKERIEEAIRNRQYACATGVQKNMTSNEDFDEAFVMYRRIFSKEGGSLCIARSSIALSELKKILKNAGITEHTTFVILDKDNSVIYYTGDMKKDRLYKVVKQWKSSSMSGKLENRSYYGEAFYTKVSENSIRLLALIPAEEIDRQTNNIMYMFLAMGGILIFATLVISSTVVRGYVRRLTRLNEKMSAIRNGQMNLNLESPLRVRDTEDEIELIDSNFEYMVRQIRVLLQEHYKMGKSVQNAELKALQAQINPHFLYNTLDLVNWMALDYDAEEISQIMRDLAKFYRLSLNHGRNLLTIREEAEHVRTYVRIENVHFDNAISLEMDLPEEIMDFGCPNIILQPFMENSIVHGMAEHPEITSCEIKVRAEREGEDVIFHISDDGPGMEEKQITELLEKDYYESSRGNGVRNINFRLKLYFGEEYGISYAGTGSQGTVVTVKIPAKTMEDMLLENPFL